MADVGVTVVGAGVVGLAVAARLAPRHPDLVLLERRDKPGQEQSSRNSEVIHAGMYYPTGSLKARLCVEGKRRLYERCEKKGIPYARVTKIITAATEDELPALDSLLERGRANGVEMERLGPDQVKALEPHVRSVGALYSPSTGIVNAHALMDSLLAEAREAGAVIQPRSDLIALEPGGGSYRLTVRSGGETESFTSDWVVNAAGLASDQVAALAGIDVDAAGYRLHYCKGSYFSVVSAKAKLVSRLIYPVPGHVSLGLHAVVGLEGRLRFGPDVEYLPGRQADYAVADASRARFGEAARRLVPAITDDDLTPDMSGIRAKLQGPGEPFRDFVIAEESARGLPRLIDLLGIDSPGLTSSLAIAEEVARLVSE
jgi:L-2-hydroxyglutarate oxidase LhgO